MKLYSKDWVEPEKPAKPEVTNKDLVREAKAYLEANGCVYLQDLVSHMMKTFPRVFVRKEWAEKITTWYSTNYSPPPKEEEVEELREPRERIESGR